MDFIIENYVWFIVFGIIILMAIIGYIADKTDFGRKGKNLTEAKPKTNKKVEKKEKIKIEPQGINDLSKSVAEKQQVNTENNKVADIIAQDNTNLSNNENIDQSLFAPLSDNNVATVDNLPKQEELKNIETTKLDNVEINNSNNQQVAEEEDIWKF